MFARVRESFRKPAPFDPQAIAERNLREAEERREMYREQGRREASSIRWYEGYDQGYTDGFAACRAQGSVKDEPGGCTECTPPADSPDSYFPKET